ALDEPGTREAVHPGSLAGRPDAAAVLAAVDSGNGAPLAVRLPGAENLRGGCLCFEQGGFGVRLGRPGEEVGGDDRVELAAKHPALAPDAGRVSTPEALPRPADLVDEDRVVLGPIEQAPQRLVLRLVARLHA